MKLYTVLVLILMISNPIVFAQDKSWVNTKDLELAYEIDFPEKVEKEFQEVPTDKGNVNMVSYMLSPNNMDNLVYMSSYTKYPSSFFPNGLDTFEKQHKVLDGAVNGAAANVKGQLIADKKIVFNGYNGRSIKIELESGGTYIINMKMFLVDYKLYMMQTICAKGNDGNSETTRFFDSFELLNVKQ